MPILNIKISGQQDPALTLQVSEALLELTTRVLGKKREVTAIVVDYISPEQWVIGGASLASQGKRSFYFDVKVTDGTNTKDEKARYISECFAALERLLSPLHEVSYIYVQDLREQSWGYGGLTQEYRYIKSKP